MGLLVKGQVDTRSRTGSGATLTLHPGGDSGCHLHATWFHPQLRAELGLGLLRQLHCIT